MPQELLPLFPLPVVLFPRTQLPLHIFEDRYKEMIGDAIRAKSEFGVVLAGEKGVANIGCTAIVEKVTNRYDDGRFDIITVGLRRFEILDIDTEGAFLRGSVTFFNDDETSTVPSDLTVKAVEGYEQLRELLTDEEEAEPDWDDPQLSFQLGQPVTDLEFRQHLLITRSEVERIRLLAEFLPTYLGRQKHISHVRSVAPRNGHGPSPNLS